MAPAHAVAGFLLAVLPLIATPGASLALLVRQVAAHGRGRAVPVVLGTVGGLGVHAGLAIAGLATVLAHSERAFTAVRWAGGVYLIGLAAHTWWSAARVRRTVPGGGPAFVPALLANVLNPKAASIYLTLVPQFLDPGRPLPGQILLLAAAHAALLAGWLLLWTLLLGRTATAPDRPRLRRWAPRATAVVLLVLGVRALV
ncbi:LysE family translocator [Streptomyces sp. TLI_171]|uniref:LysE family translocator n=1 Tax=Streptomyces sp. TLI_171 TaxID=1938859 RepID=UPI000C190F82|nr:LysE family translocator [Streptomyces sp. TLI_171]RKE17878.1 threonine/homoserine/homoserine lactone efflux protein [Streptomyces sp. TLI_171]